MSEEVKGETPQIAETLSIMGETQSVPALSRPETVLSGTWIP